IWDFIWLLIRFFTYGQAANLWAILHFVYDFTLLNIQNALDYLNLAQLWQRLPNPQLPRAEIRSFSFWLLIVWQLTTMIALGEERRLWLAANPRTAAYMRGMQFRNPYPRWGLFQVDYALLEPALGGLSVWLHRLYFSPGVLGSVRDVFGVVAYSWQSLLHTLSYSKIEEAVVHAKDLVLNAGNAAVTVVFGAAAALWALLVRMMPSWPGVSSMQSGDPGVSVNPPSLSDPQFVHGGPAWWEIFWEYFKDLVVRTLTGRRKVSHE
ncbi:hypothetical protein N0V82_005606, partial [Gnomoniopsis sp. IMI 355080]